VMQKIERFGWAIQHVDRDRIHPPWSYTVGLTMFDEPELVVTGLPASRASALLHRVAKHPLPGDLPRRGQQLKLIDGPLMQIVEVAEPTAHLVIAVELFGPRIRALQLVHADDRGHWPWEPGYRGVRGGQPVLGIPVTSPAAQPGTPASLDAQEAGGSSGGAVREKSTVRTRTSRGSGRAPGTRAPRRRSAR